MRARRFRISWGALTAVEPTRDEFCAAAGYLALAYNDPHNRRMMGHEPMSEADVVAYHDDMIAAQARLFLLHESGVLVGDADVRHIEARHAEMAIMIGARSAQGKGLGARFSLLLHAFAFRVLHLDRIYVTILAHNTPSRRLFEKLGYQPDQSPEARAHVDDVDDVSMSIAEHDFTRAHRAALDEIAISALAGT